jgi:hypothetical protein
MESGPAEGLSTVIPWMDVSQVDSKMLSTSALDTPSAGCLSFVVESQLLLSAV